MRASVNLTFVKGFSFHRQVALIHKLLMGQRSRYSLAVLAFAKNDEANSRRVQRGVAPPLAILFRGSGDDLVIALDDPIDGGDIFGARLPMRYGYVGARRLRLCRPLRNCNRLGNCEKTKHTKAQSQRSYRAEHRIVLLL